MDFLFSSVQLHYAINHNFCFVPFSRIFFFGITNRLFIALFPEISCLFYLFFIHFVRLNHFIRSYIE